MSKCKWIKVTDAIINYKQKISITSIHIQKIPITPKHNTATRQFEISNEGKSNKKEMTKSPKISKKKKYRSSLFKF